jgi:hypothetical protein
VKFLRLIGLKTEMEVTLYLSTQSLNLLYFPNDQGFLYVSNFNKHILCTTFDNKQI